MYAPDRAPERPAAVSPTAESVSRSVRGRSPAGAAPTGAPQVARRTMLAGAGAIALLGTAGCNPFSTTRTTRTQTVVAPPPIDPMDNLIATTEFQVLRLKSAVALGGDIATTLNPILADRTAHLTALAKERARTAPGSRSSLATTGTVSVPKDRDAVIAMARDDAGNAQIQFTDALGPVSRYRSALLASIAACLATHRVVLG